MLLAIMKNRRIVFRSTSFLDSQIDCGSAMRSCSPLMVPHVQFPCFINASTVFICRPWRKLLKRRRMETRQAQLQNSRKCCSLLTALLPLPNHGCKRSKATWRLRRRKWKKKRWDVSILGSALLSVCAH